MTDTNIQDWLEVFAALASDARLEIVRMISKQQMTCQDIIDQLELSQPAISYHLAKLERAGILTKKKFGSRNCYWLNERLEKLVEMINEEDR
ncbi:winged helix-turn-helix transcriptional regulator [Candidatus Bipolaricaulota bacterium]|nr:winged helix-turn-helix transcriptional regulator [Candidatus Bipolaricaulota bacterium]HHR85949.1 ArsR family transcriptional regulator [Candidatus Acetothermia bacterium]